LREGFAVDKITCIAFLLYHSAKSKVIKEKAIQLLNGEVSLHDLKRNISMQAQIVVAESLVKKNNIDRTQVQNFAEEFMLIEV
jgi:hypothetical protein